MINLQVTSTDSRRDAEYPKGVLWQSGPESTNGYPAGLLPTYKDGVLTLPAQNPFARSAAYGARRRRVHVWIMTTSCVSSAR